MQSENTAVCPESTIDSAPQNARRGFLKKAALIAGGVAIGSTLLGGKMLSKSSAQSNGSSVKLFECCPSCVAIEGHTCTGVAVEAFANGTSGTGLWATSSCGPAVVGESVSGCGVRAGSNTGVAVNAVGGTVGVESASCKIGVLAKSSIFAPCAIPLVARGTACQNNDLQQWRNCSCTPLSVVDKSGHFGIGTAAPSSSLEVNGTTFLTQSSSSSPTLCVNNLGGGPGVSVGVIGSGTAIRGLAPSTGVGIFGCGGTGVKGNSASGIGIVGHSCSTIGVNGSSSRAQGVFGQSFSGTGAGVAGIATCGTGGTGVFGEGSGFGVQAQGSAASSIPLVALGVATQTNNLQQWEKGPACKPTVLSVVNKNGWLGLGAKVASTTLHVNGSVSAKAALVSANYKMKASDFAVLASASATAGITITLPPAKTSVGMIVFIKKVDANNGKAVTVTVAGTDTIEGNPSFALNKQYDSVQLISNGKSEWFILVGSRCGAFIS
jgi:hypothetical protein